MSPQPAHLPQAEVELGPCPCTRSPCYSSAPTRGSAGNCCSFIKNGKERVVGEALWGDGAGTPPICAARGSSLSCWGVGWKRCRRTWARPGRPLTGSHHWAGELPWWGQSAELALWCPTPREGFGTPHPPAAPHPGVEEPVPTCPHVPWTRVHPGLDYAHEHGDPSPKAPGMLLLLHPSALGVCRGRHRALGTLQGRQGCTGGVGTSQVALGTRRRT